MENFNRVLSFVLGLVVVIVFIIVLSGRLNLGSRLIPSKTTAKVSVTPTPTKAPKKPGFFSRLFAKKTPTPTPSTAVVPTTVVNQPVMTQPTTAPAMNNQQQPKTIAMTKGGQPVNEIPSTGPETAMLPLLGMTGLLGIYLKKRK